MAQLMLPHAGTEDDEDVDAALLEWVNSSVVKDPQQPALTHLRELGDGKLLLQVMHDVSPDDFPQRDIEALRIQCLLEGLRVQFHGQSGENTAHGLLQHSHAIGSAFGAAQLAQMVQLVVVGAIDHGGEASLKYVEACTQLSEDTQKAVAHLHYQLTANAPPASPGSFSPMSRPGSFPMRRQTVCSTTGRDEGSAAFLDVRLPLETRFKHLKDLYIALIEERDHWEVERNALQLQLEAERERRADAEKYRAMACEELKMADNAKEQLKEEHRSSMDIKVELQVARYMQDYNLLRQDYNQMQEDLDISRSQAAQAEKWEPKCREAQKLVDKWSDEVQRLRDLNAELQEHKDKQVTASGAVEHLHKRIEEFRAGSSEVMREKDMAQEQYKIAAEELEKSQQKQRELQEQLRRMQRDGHRQASPLRAFSPSGRASSGSLANLSEEARMSLLHSDSQAASPQVPRDSDLSGASGSGGGDAATRTPSRGTPSRRDKPRPPMLPLDSTQAASPAVSMSPKNSSSSTDLLERLLAAGERAARAETTLQTQKAQIESLTDQSSRDALRILALEGQKQGLEAAKPKDDGEVDERDKELLQKERELQVLRYRRQTESKAVATQEMFMATCFHEIGLKYHKLRAEHELMKRKPCTNCARRTAASPEISPRPNSSAPSSAAATPNRTVLHQPTYSGASPNIRQRAE